MAFERLLRLTKKCPGYVVSGLRNASVGIATVTQESFKSQYYITRALFGTRSLFTMTAALAINPLYPNRILEHCSILLRKPENSCIFCYSVNKQLQLENKRKITITSLFCLKGHKLFVNMISNMY